MTPQPARVHLALRKLGGAVDERLQARAELLGEQRPDVERLAPGEPHEVGVGLEERERGAQHPLDLGPALDQVADRVVDDREPVRERLLEHRAVERVLGREVVQQARPADPDLVGDLAQARGRQPVLGEAAPGDVEDQRLGVDGATRGMSWGVSAGATGGTGGA